MNQSEELLLFIAQNARMGADNITNLLTLLEDETKLYAVLEAQRKGYLALHEEAVSLLKEKHLEEQEPPVLPKMAAFIGLRWNTMTDKSPAHIAQLLVEGGTMGIVDITRHMNNVPDAEGEVLHLAKKLLRFEEGAQEKFKEYL